MTNLSIDEAKKEKWRLGQIKYGPVFVGHPLEQLDDELIDAMNYCDIAENWGYDMRQLQYTLHRICEEVRYKKQVIQPRP